MLQFGSVKTSPQLKDGTLASRPTGYDGIADDGYVLDSETSSPEGNSPLMMQTLGPKKPAAINRSQSEVLPRSQSPAPMTGFTGTSPMYPYYQHGGGSMFGDGLVPKAIRG